LYIKFCHIFKTSWRWPCILFCSCVRVLALCLKLVSLIEHEILKSCSVGTWPHVMYCSVYGETMNVFVHWSNTSRSCGQRRSNSEISVGNCSGCTPVSWCRIVDCFFANYWSHHSDFAYLDSFHWATKWSVQVIVFVFTKTSLFKAIHRSKLMTFTILGIFVWACFSENGI